MYFYRTTCYGGCRNGAEGAGGGGLKSADCRPANWRPAAARGSPTSMPRMVVGDPEPTPQRQKLPLPMRQSPGAKWVRESGGWEKRKTNKWSLCRRVTGGESEDKWIRRKQKGRKRGNRPDPERPASLNYPCPCHSATPPLRYSATADRAVMLELATLAPSQAGTYGEFRTLLPLIIYNAAATTATVVTA